MENDVEWVISVLFFFNDTATTEIYTLSLHDALPIYRRAVPASGTAAARRPAPAGTRNSRPGWRAPARTRSEEHTSELQSRLHLVCRLLLEKKNKLRCRLVSSIPSYRLPTTLCFTS